MTPAAPTVGDALLAFRRSHGLPHDEHLQRTWACRLGRTTLRLPNFRWRRRAILAHDLHHVLTGYPCTLRGECCMAAWEFGAGRMPHWAASGFCMPLVAWGMLTAPAAIWSAFRRGRRGRSLHALTSLDALIAAPLAAASHVVATGSGSRYGADPVHFALLLLRATAVIVSPLIVLGLALFTLP